jgi:hypothetical protein
VSAGRVLIWSGDPLFVVTAASYLTRWDFEVVECPSFPFLERSLDLIVADIDRLPLTWCKSLSGLRTRDESVALILVSSGWPNFARLHSWRPCGYVRKPLSMDDLMRPVHDLMSGVQAAHRKVGDSDECSPAPDPDRELERRNAERAA